MNSQVASVTLGTVQAPIVHRLPQVQAELRRIVEADFALIADVNAHLFQMQGKMFRPTLTLLTDEATGGPDSRAVALAATIELIHLATLVHDDVMDAADVRRRRLTASREYGPAPAVLVGDALFAHGLYLATQFPTTEICAAVTESTRRVCAGARPTSRVPTTSESWSSKRPSSSVCHASSARASPDRSPPTSRR